MTQRPTGRGPLAANDVVNLGDPLPVEQCVTALKPPAAPEENLPDWAQCAPESAPNSATRLTIDDGAVNWHLQLLGLTTEANIRGIPHKGKKGQAYNGKAWELGRAEKWQAEGCGVYLQVNPGGTKATEIDNGVALFFEHDDRPVLEQIGIWDDHGLPHPTFSVMTGGKSVHHYYVLKQPIDVPRWVSLLDRLHLQAAGCDKSCKGANRLMRLAGAWYINSKGDAVARSAIINVTGDRYPAELFEELLPAVHKTCKTYTTSTVSTNVRPAGCGPARAGKCTLSVRQIAEALDHIPRRVGGSGTYAMYRDVLWGLKAALADAGGDEALAIRLMEAHSPSEQCDWDVEQVCLSGGDHIGPGTLFHYAKQHGWSRHAER